MTPPITFTRKTRRLRDADKLVALAEKCGISNAVALKSGWQWLVIGTCDEKLFERFCASEAADCK